ncbi:MAG TPA: PAS domain S-box protein [Bacteroidota bacterium]|nr:PAS domain S-box protein [Bacteroidota bacterium]
MSSPIDILHVEDSDHDAELVVSILESEGFQCHVTRVQTRDEMLRALNGARFDLIISDHSLPGFDGKTALKIATAEQPEVPFIFLSGTIGEDSAIEALLNGATDYVLKTKISKLVPAVRRALVEAENRRIRGAAERALEESERRHRSLVENSQDAIALLSTEGKVLYASASTLRVIGYEPDDFRGRTLSDLILDDDREKFRTMLSDSMSRPGAALSLSLRLAAGDGSERWIEGSVTNLLQDPALAAIVMNYRDVTIRRNAQVELNKLSRALERTGDNIVITDKNGLIEYVNPSFESTTGYQRAEVEGKTPRILKSGKHPLRFYEELWSTILSGRMYRGSFVNKRKNGELYFEEHTITPIFDDAGGISHFVSVGRDITERREALEALRNSEERFRSLVEGARDAIFSLSTSGVITSLNPAFEAITGWLPAEWLGKSFTDLLHPDDRQRAAEMFRSVIAGNFSGTNEYRIRHKNGEYLVGEFSTTTQYLRGKAVGMLGIARDVTASRRLEEQLRQSQKLEGIGTLAGGIAHDFNNILGIILAYSTLLQRRPILADQMDEAVAAITKAVQRGSGLVRQLLTFARKSESVIDLVDLNQLLGELSGMLIETFPKTIEFSVEPARDMPAIRADQSQIYQALLNLCVNARDAMPTGGTLVIRTFLETGLGVRKRISDAHSDSYVAVQISDSGVGMPENVRARIFEPFFTTKPAGKGTGLGLAVVYGAVKSFGGVIDVESEPGKGTSFTVYFPVPQENAQLQVDKAGGSDSTVGGTETVMVVEDEEAMKELLLTYLRDKGYSVLAAGDGKEALEIFSKHHREISLVFSDFGLPKMDGLSLFQRMREVNPSVRTIVATGFIDPEQKSEMLKKGVKDVIPKPYAIEDVLRRIRKIIDT